MTAVGAGVPDFRLGDRVALEVGLPCDDCALCRSGRYNICRRMRFRSSAKAFPHFQGTLQERINHPARWCYRLPEGVSLELGALLEPLSVATHAARRARIPAGASVLVFGAGTIGLLCAYAAKQKGAGVVSIADIDEGRVGYALENGFVSSGCVLRGGRPGPSPDEKLEAAKVTAQTVGEKVFGDKETGFDIIFECTGVEPVLQAAIYAAKPGGRIMLIGMGTPVQTLPISHAALREVDLCGVFRYADTYNEGISLVEKARHPDLQRLVTHRLEGLEQAEEAFRMAARTKDEDGNLILKVVLNSPTKSDASVAG